VGPRLACTCGRREKYFDPTETAPRIFHLVVCPFTDYATTPPQINKHIYEKVSIKLQHLNTKRIFSLDGSACGDTKISEDGG